MHAEAFRRVGSNPVLLLAEFADDRGLGSALPRCEDADKNIKHWEGSVAGSILLRCRVRTLTILTIAVSGPDDGKGMERCILGQARAVAVWGRVRGRVDFDDSGDSEDSGCRGRDLFVAGIFSV
jgi:hypothetical protein